MDTPSSSRRKSAPKLSSNCALVAVAVSGLVRFPLLELLLRRCHYVADIAYAQTFAESVFASLRHQINLVAQVAKGSVYSVADSISTWSFAPALITSSKSRR